MAKVTNTEAGKGRDKVGDGGRGRGEGVAGIHTLGQRGGVSEGFKGSQWWGWRGQRCGGGEEGRAKIVDSGGQDGEKMRPQLCKSTDSAFPSLVFTMVTVDCKSSPSIPSPPPVPALD